MTTALGPDDPERIGGYWLASRLGAGGQGVVYEAYDAHGARVALKVLHRGAEEFVRERFGREAAAARKVASFCTARILDVSTGSAPARDGGGPEDAAPVPYIVSEYVSGPTLAARVRERGPLDEDAVLRLATGAATALTAIHHADVIHRDLKPGNILLGPDGPRIIDFGIARAPDMSVTATGALLGTLGYMAPEVLSGKRATTASDIFAWGAVVLYAASAKEPFRGANIAEVAHRTASVDPDLSVIPPRIRPLIAAALAKEPEVRPTAQELVLGLVGKLPETADPRRALLEAGTRRAAAANGTAAVPSLGERAESAFTALEPSAQLAGQQLLLRLVAPGEAADGSQDSVRTADQAELYEGRPDSERRPLREAVDRLAEAGILTVSDDGSVRPSGAALLPAWRRLHDWIAADRTGLTLQRSLGRSARTWQAHGERTDDLLHGTALRTCLDWLPTAPFQLRPNPLEVRFLAAAQAEAARAARRRRQLLSGLAVLTVLALLGGVFGVFQARESSRQREAAELRRAQATARSVAQAAESLRNTEPDTALLLSLAAWRVAEVPEARAALGAGATQRTLGSISLPRMESGDAAGQILLGTADALLAYRPGSAEIWELSKGRAGARKPRVTFPDGVTKDRSSYRPTVSPDGRLLLVPGESGTYRAVSTHDGKATGAVYPAPDGVLPATMSDKGHVLFTDYGDTDDMGSVLLGPDGKKIAGWTSPGDPVLSSDGTHLATCGDEADAPLEVWKITAGGLQELFTAVDPDNSTLIRCTSDVTFSSDSSRLAMQKDSSGIAVWDTASGTLIHTVATPTGMDSVRLSGDGRSLFGFSHDGDIALVDVAGDSVLLRIAGTKRKEEEERGWVVDQAVLDDRTKTVAYLNSRGNEIARIDVSAVLSATAQGENAEGVAVSPDGKVGLLRIGAPVPHSQQLIDLATGKKRGGPIRQRVPLAQIPPVDQTHALSDDGRFVAFIEFDEETNQTVTVWDTAENRKVWGAPVPKDRSVFTLSLSPDGRHLSVLHDLAGSPSGKGADMDVWDVPEKKRVHRFEGINAMGLFSPDSGTLLTSRGDVLDLASGKLRRVTEFDLEPTGYLTYSPDGETLAVLKESGWLELWDGQVRKRLARMPSSTVRGGTHYGQDIREPVFSQDRRFLAAAVGDTGGAVQLWDLETRSMLGKPIDPTGNTIDAIGFHDDKLLTISGSRTHTLDLDPDRLAETICKKAGRDITREEWQLYVPDAPYRALC